MSRIKVTTLIEIEGKALTGDGAKPVALHWEHEVVAGDNSCHYAQEVKQAVNATAIKVIQSLAAYDAKD